MYPKTPAVDIIQDIADVDWLKSVACLSFPSLASWALTALECTKLSYSWLRAWD